MTAMGVMPSSAFTIATAQVKRAQIAKDRLRRYCEVFSVDYPKLMEEVDELHKTTVHDYLYLLEWARNRVTNGNAPKIAKPKPSYDEVRNY